MTATCQTCAYVRLNERSGELECRIGPPKVFVLRRGTTAALWPDVRPDDWCASHGEADR